MTVSLVVRGGAVVDGTGSPARRADVAIDADRIVLVGEVPADVDAIEIDATGHVVAPGFINVLSHAWDSLQVGRHGHSDLLQGVTTEVFGEGVSLGPSCTAMERIIDRGGRIPGTRTDFARLGEGLDHLQQRGTALNVASFVGGHNLRALGGGFDDGPLCRDGLDLVRGVLEEEMSDGALGLGTALIYPPGSFARTDELTALAEVVARHDGLYVSHLRSEGGRFAEALEELLSIGRLAQARTEVYHLKAGGRSNWPKMAVAIEAIEVARATGQAVSASMYPYNASATSLITCVPPRHRVGDPQWLRRCLADQTVRQEIKAEIRADDPEWENLYQSAGGGSGILLLEDLYDGTPVNARRLDALAHDLGRDDLDLLLDVCQHQQEMDAAYFTIDEANVRLGLCQPWVSICSDAPAFVAEPPWTDVSAHPRTYGSFARVLGHYARDLGLFDLPEAVRRMTSLPAETLRLRDRGVIAAGAMADVVVFDPGRISDTATYDAPHSYATGVRHVIVNGTPAVLDGAVKDALPGRRLRRGV